MSYEIKTFSNLEGLKGFSKELIDDHLKLYEGYVENTVKIEQTLITIDIETSWSELNRRYSWEYNGMKLHELYFEQFAKERIEPTSSISKQLKKDFGSVEMWQDEFDNMARMRGIGWVVLYKLEDGTLVNGWINEHNEGLLVNAKPLLVMDIFEHAFIKDFGLDRESYIFAFHDSLDWSVIDKRWQ